MFTDLADYTAAVSRSDREGLRRLLAEHEELVSPAVRRFGGQVVKNLGDSFMCLFASATDALRCALDVQEATAQGATLAMRMGVNTGDVEEIDGDAFGDAVNVAARVLAKAPAGEVWFGPGTRACMNAAEIPWEPVGRFQLRGLAGDVDVFRAVPATRCWLPEPVAAAARGDRLLRLRRGQAVPSALPPDPVVLLEGFVPGSPELADILSCLPVLEPDRVWLSTWHVAPADRHAWTEEGRGLVIGTPAALDIAIAEAQRAPCRYAGSDTIVLDGVGPGDLQLVISGLALPAVPLADVVASYFYELLSDGRWATQADQGLLRVEVTPEGASLIVRSKGVAVDGRLRAVDEVIPLIDGMRVEAAGTTHVFRALDGVGTGYVGALLGDTAMRLGVADGQEAELGREPNHPGLAFPDRRGQGNIRWCSGARSARARAGGFTLDRALAGRRQAVVVFAGGDLKVVPLHERCATWVLRDGAHVLERVPGPTRVAFGDHVVAGTTVVGLRRAE